MTYLELFQLTQRPFANRPAPSLFFSCEEQEGAVRQCVAALEQATGLTFVTADDGLGKTEFALRLAAVLPAESWIVRSLTVPHAALTERGFLRRACTLFAEDGLWPSRDEDETHLSARLDDQLDGARKRGLTPVLIIDEADLIARSDVIHTLARLSSKGDGDKPRLEIVLLGRPSCAIRLGDALRRAGNDHAEFLRLEAFAPDTVAAYVQHRLTVAGAPNNPFTAEALDTLHQLTAGAPRRINLLCEAALVEAARHGHSDIERDLIARLATSVEPIQDAAPNLAFLSNRASATPLTGEELAEVDRALDALRLG